MRILQVIPVFSPVFGGPVTVVRSISRELAKRHDVTVYTTGALDHKRDFHNLPIKDESDRYRVVYFPRILRSIGFNISLSMARALRENLCDYDIVHLHSWRHFQDIIVHHHAKKYGVPYLLQVHGSLLRTGAKRRFKWIYDIFFGYRLLRNASKVIALSPVEARQYRCMGMPEDKIAIIPNGIDLLEHTNLPHKERFKERYGIEKGKRVILYLGRINRFKGIDFLIDAFAYLVKNMKYANAILVIAGPDDGYLDETKKLIKQHKIQGSVLFTGPLFGIRKAEAYVDASIVASLDSLKEVVFLLVPLEAAACGTPVIVTKSNYIAQLVENGKFGSWVEYGNVLKLASMLKEILNDEDLLREMGSKGRNFVLRNFNWKNIVSMIEEVYENAIRRTSH